MRTGQIRVIAGLYKGRKLKVGQAPGLRPTTDSNKETLFNWLQPYIKTCRCLDLYAGSGALGIEALSRFAKAVTFVENNKQTFLQLKTNLQNLQCEQKSALYLMSAKKFLQENTELFDIIFLDPPFSESGENIQAIFNYCYSKVTSQGLIYIESTPNVDVNHDSLQLLKEKKTSQVRLRLYQKNVISEIPSSLKS